MDVVVGELIGRLGGMIGRFDHLGELMGRLVRLWRPDEMVETVESFDVQVRIGGRRRRTWATSEARGNWKVGVIALQIG